jgi:hypothetical protein
MARVALGAREPGGRRGLVAVGVYALLAAVSSIFAAMQGHPEAWLSLLVVPLAVLVRDRPALFALSFVLGGTFLRLAFLGLPRTNGNVAVVEAAAAVAFGGGDPYGRVYAESIPPGEPYPYGPLGILLGPFGIGAEVVAAVATMLLLGWTRSWITLSVYASLVAAVRLGTAGANDVSAGLLITAGLLALREHRVLGCLLLAAAAGTKQYALAWFPGAIGFAGVEAVISLLVGTLVAWSPVLMWGPASVLRSMQLASELHPIPQNTLNIPVLRLVAAPIALAALFVRRWRWVVLSGAAIFMVVLFFDRWASLGYLLAVGPIVGVALERPDEPRAHSGGTG